LLNYDLQLWNIALNWGLNIWTSNLTESLLANNGVLLL